MHSLNEFKATQTPKLHSKVSRVCVPRMNIKIEHWSTDNSTQTTFLYVTHLDNEIAQLLFMMLRNRGERQKIEALGQKQR